MPKSSSEILLPALLFYVLLVPPAWGAEPAAIVEEAPPSATGVRFMDYLKPGRKIVLREGDTIVLGYLRSCLRERISGGRLTVGNEMSTVVGGRVSRQKVECDGGQANLTAAQVGKSGAMAYRVEPGQAPPRPPKPEFTIFSTSPLVHLPGGGLVVITRLDRGEPSIRVRLDKDVLDFTVIRKELIPGAVYRVQAGEKILIIGVDPFARSGGGPIVGRLIRF